MTLNDTVEEFDLLFPIVADQKITLLSFAGKVTESNYIEKVEYFLANSDQFSDSIQTILKAQKFIKKTFQRSGSSSALLKRWRANLKVRPKEQHNPRSAQRI